MSRAQRKNRTDIEYVNKGQITDAFDNAIKQVLRISDEEYDYIAEHATDNDLKILLNQSMTFKSKREFIKVLDKYITMYKETKKV
jgi:hypothetical protein